MASIPRATDKASEGLEAVLADYLRAAEEGRAPDRMELLARHPDLAPELAAFFAGQDRFGRLAAPLREVVSAVQESTIEEKLAEGGRLGDFRLLREIGRGGMGVVYEAEQLSLGRRVALKVLPFASTLDPKQLQRFKNEAQAAAGLHHTNIVPVYATGCERGVHYYAMQFIEGQTLAALIRELRQLTGLENPESRVDDRRSGAQGSLLDSLLTASYTPEVKSPERTEDRTAEPKETPSTIQDRASGAETSPAHLRSSILDSRSSPFFCTVANLGIQAAEALEHAHQLGVVHRDIKPANLIVESLSPPGENARGEGSRLWITDFGLAHCQSQAGLTMTGDLVGTLRYMSPEQALAKRELVDHRTDIYSLGATLYELLTLEPAFRGGDRQELLRQIAFEEPRPLRRINKSIPPELETIVLKSMEKTPSERYATAQEVADDLRRFLQHEPILAKKPTWIQRAGKWLRRHPAVARSAIVVLFLITAGSLLSTWLISRERDRAETNEQLAKEESERAEKEKQIAQAVRDFLQKRLLGQADTHQQANALLMAGRRAADAKWNPTIGELLDRAAAELAPDKIEAQFPNQPLVQAEILQTLGDTYKGIGHYKQAIAHLERARDLGEREFGPEDPETLVILSDLATAYYTAGRLTEAIRLFEQVRDKQIHKLGSDHPDMLNTLNNLACAYQDAGRLPEAIGLYEQVRDKQIRKLGPDHLGTLITLNNLAAAYKATDRLPEAIRLLEEVRDKEIQMLGPDHPETLIALNNLASTYVDAGRLSDGLPLLEQVRDKRIQKLGPDHPDTLQTLFNLGATYKAAGRLPEAIGLLEQVRDKQIQELGPDHPDTLLTLNNLGVAYLNSSRLPEAIRLLEQVRDKRIEVSGPDHRETVNTLNNLGTAYWYAQWYPEAIRLFEEAGQKRAALLGRDHLDTLKTLNALAKAYKDGGRAPDAIRLSEQVRHKLTATVGADHPETFTALHNLAAAYSSLRQLDHSVPLFEELLEKHKVKLGVNHPDTLQTMANLAADYRDAGRLTEAIPLLEEALSRVRKLPGLMQANVTWIPRVMAETYEEAGQFAKAEPLYREFVAQARQQSGAGDPWTARMLAFLGANLVQQNKSAEAETFLRECLAIRDKKEPDAWTTFNAKSMLGGALLTQKKYAAAEPLLLQGYEGMKQREASIPPQGKVRLTEALERLVRLCEANGQKDQADKWRQKLAEQKKKESEVKRKEAKEKPKAP